MRLLVRASAVNLIPLAQTRKPRCWADFRFTATSSLNCHFEVQSHCQLSLTFPISLWTTVHRILCSTSERLLNCACSSIRRRGMSAMSTSPTKLSTPYLPPINLPSTLQPTSPRAHRTIRRLQSAQTLSSNASSPNSPSLISQQRQQQQQQRHVAGNHRDPLPSQNLSIPATRTHHRSRSNSDAAVTSITPSGPAPRRNAAAKRIVAPGVSIKHQLEVLIREGPPKGDVTEGLRELRYFVLSDGVDADHDGMVGKASDWYRKACT